MIPTTPFELEIVRRVQAGELCPTVLDHGDLCGREIHKGHGVGLCQWHSEELLGLKHAGEDPEPPSRRNVCTRCQKYEVAYKASRMCRNCHKVMHRQHIVESGRRRTAAIAGRHG